MEMGNDRLSAMTDRLLCSFILSKLCLRDAVRCSILSRRWRSLWTLLPHLNFTEESFESIVCSGSRVTNKKRKRAIDNIFLFHSTQIESLQLSELFLNSGHNRKKEISEWFWKWIRCAAFKRVKEIDLTDTYSKYNRLNVPTSLYLCDCLICLKLMRFTLTKLPRYFCGFPYLITCSLSCIDINDEILEQLVAKCPLLENLTLTNCTGLSDLKIFAINLNYLNLTGDWYINSVKVNSPQLQNIIVDSCSYMSTLELSSCHDVHLSTTENTLFEGLEGISTIKLLKKITLHAFITPVPPLVLGKFSYLEELYLESECFEEAEAASLILPLQYLKKVHVKVSKFEDEKIAMLGCLLRSSPLLQTMTLALPECSEHIHELRFLQQVLGLKRSSREARVFVTEKYGLCSGCAELFDCPNFEYLDSG